MTKFFVAVVIHLCMFTTSALRIPKSMVHKKCRDVPWAAVFENYNPPEYESSVLSNKDWADPPLSDPSFKPKWNELDGKVNRKSYEGEYSISDGRPMNPAGRTGVKGRGVLGKWGPNHAADPIVTRWKRVDGARVLDTKSNKPVLQFCAIQRHDCDEWALPGGMVDPGESVSATLKREFIEEAFNGLAKEPSEPELRMIDDFFENGMEIYRGYVDDPRNTDNAWIETCAVNFHDDDGRRVGKFSLEAGDDAKSVRWTDLDAGLSLYANHAEFLKRVAEIRGACW
ncbi:ADP-ribose pyrophosphatase, mitochondrial isoform X2 [Cylas formicarius]|uniref:ADP-ribose pyrophosphatase, mitochondrial isoform X2 n=1 Tax=Cylas formicarius TaxID=197179 RepID=UPI0029584C57|nr:ADP-ribose pyrophosphatase, mitochondrial isoform X2 [Cylas formicarius]